MRSVTSGPARTYGATATSVPLVALEPALLTMQLFLLPLWWLCRARWWPFASDGG